MTGKTVAACNKFQAGSANTREPFFKSLSDSIGWFIRFYRDRIEGIKAVRQLSRLDDRMLNDIGLTRADVIRVAMSDVPEKSLIELNSRIYRR